MSKNGGPARDVIFIKEPTLLIDWVNSLALPSCALVDCIQDLQNGAVISDILTSFLRMPSISSEHTTAWSAISSFLGISIPSNQISPKLIVSVLQRIKNNLTVQNEEPDSEIEELSAQQNISPLIKEAIKDWLISLNLVKRQNSIESLEESIRTGVLLCQLVNRVEGRSQPIKAIERHPKTITAALANSTKALQHLRQYPKMNGRYLWAAKDILNGNQTVIWGIIEDIRDFYSVVKSNLSLSKSGFTHNKTAIYSQSPSKTIRSYASLSKSQSTRKTLRAPQSMQEELTIWINALDIQFQRDPYRMRDPIYNGILLCEVVKTLTGVIVPLNPYPQSNKDIRQNFETVVEVLKHKNVPIHLIQSAKALMNDSPAFWSLLFYLYTAYPYAVPLTYKNSVLPYSTVEIKLLQQKVVNWLVKLGIVKQNRKPTFQQVIHEMKSGVLLCEVVYKVTGQAIKSVVINPVTDTSALNNIRKSLQILRMISSMPQRFTWSEKQIFNGNASVILGLLENIEGLSSNPKPNLVKQRPSTDPLRFSVEYSTRIGSQTFQRTQSDVQKNIYAVWIDSLGVNLNADTDFDSKNLPEFKSGVLLCDIVSKVERVTIPFVARKVASTEGALRNIRRALDILRRKSGLKNLPREEDVFQGNSQVILRLLNQIYSVWEVKQAKLVGQLAQKSLNIIQDFFV